VPTGLVLGTPYRCCSVAIHAVPAAHNTREQDAARHERYIGIVVEVGGVTIYHSGDTLRYDGMVTLLRHWAIDVALLPINGNDPARGVAGNLDGVEAAQLAHDIGARLSGTMPLRHVCLQHG
jgi:L-ascorbate metabolism protein UlaG (beta-lactamase superfamily)